MTNSPLKKTWNSLEFTLDERKEIDRRYKSGESVANLRKEFGVSETFLLNNSKRFPGEKIRYGKSLGVDENVFSKQTPESSYWAGFLITDGSVDDNGVITLRLAEKDIDQIFAFKSFVKSEHKVCQKSIITKSGKICGQAYIRFTAKKMAKDLEKYGIHPRKTYTAHAKECNNRDFWRGVIDGDGCVMIPKTRKPKGYITPQKTFGTISMVGTYELCSQFLEFCKSNGINHNCNPRKHYDSFQASFSGKYVAYVAELLYNDACHALPRKAARAKLIYDQIEHQ